MLREHCLAVFAPRGNLFKSNSIAPVELNHRRYKKYILNETHGLLIEHIINDNNQITLQTPNYVAIHAYNSYISNNIYVL